MKPQLDSAGDYHQPKYFMTIVEVRPDASQGSAAKINPAAATSGSAATNTTHSSAEIVTGVRDSSMEEIECFKGRVPRSTAEARLRRRLWHIRTTTRSQMNKSGHSSPSFNPPN